MRIIKFGGNSLADRPGLEQVAEIIENESLTGPLAVVVSARGNITDRLYQLIEEAQNGSNYLLTLSDIHQSWDNQAIPGKDILDRDLSTKIKAVATLGECPTGIEGEILAYGELSSASELAYYLSKNGYESQLVDARNLIAVVYRNGHSVVDHKKSEALVKSFFDQKESHVIPIITGFIARDDKAKTVTLGRNGSNYSASLLANYLDAKEVINYTHVDGLYTAPPEQIPDARIISNISYQEAHELANFGAHILHPTTIEPLVEKDIPLRIRNSNNPDATGTLISGNQVKGGIKSISRMENVGLIQLSGNRLQGQVGIDARIFTTLSQHFINISMISQASSERGIGFVVQEKTGERAIEILEREFRNEIDSGIIKEISWDKSVEVVSIVGNRIDQTHDALSALSRNGIRPYMITNNIKGHNLSLVVRRKDAQKSLRILHSQIFGSKKRIHLLILGRGLVGKTLLEQVFDQKHLLRRNNDLDIRVIGITNSKSWIYNPEGLSIMDHQNFDTESDIYNLETALHAISQAGLENLIAVDVTSSTSLAQSYPELVAAGFDIVSANKIFNTFPMPEYQQLRRALRDRQSYFRYETNVGAGLPIIETIHNLHASGEEIFQIHGVFSGSLSYIFNQFSDTTLPFSEIIRKAGELGLTEPDFRTDLSGMDVARKLLILAREVGLEVELGDVEVENLLPDSLRGLDSLEEFNSQIKELDETFERRRLELPKGFVWRYLAALDVRHRKLEVKLIGVNVQTVLGQLQEADTVFEIYSTSYQNRPLVIQGPGAGAAVTARGVFGDILKLSQK